MSAAAQTPSISAGLAPPGANTTTQEWVYQALRDAILLGRVAPGRPMTIRGLAADLGVSAMPVREALRRLVSEGALELPDNRRAAVPAMTPARFAQLVDARVALETLAAERALPGVDAARLAQLEAVEVPMATAISADPEDNIARNYRFHRLLYQSVPADVLMPLVESIWLQLGPFMRLAMHRLGNSYSVDRHSEAIAALVQGDAIALRLAIEADIRDGVGQLGRAELLASYRDD